MTMHPGSAPNKIATSFITSIPKNRSGEELEMRAAVETWGRQRWPGARVMHELPVDGCRIDLAFVSEDHIAGVEIKSSKDTLDRLEHQMKVFTRGLPEVWLAFAPKWIDEITISSDDRVALPWSIGHVLVDHHDLHEKVPMGPNRVLYPHKAVQNQMMTGDLLHLCMKPELQALCRVHKLQFKTSTRRPDLLVALARNLTGYELIAGVCQQLRARDTGWAADQPII